MPVLDESMLEIYYAYLKIMQGKESITLTDVKAYSDLYSVDFEDWEIDAIMGLDLARLKAWQTTQQ